MGQIYVAPVARVTDNDTGIGGSGGGSEFAGGYLLWTDKGFTGKGWYWNETPISDWWHLNHGNFISDSGESYSDDAEGLGQYIREKNITELNDAFAGWAPRDKMTFIYANGLEDTCVDWME